MSQFISKNVIAAFDDVDQEALEGIENPTLADVQAHCSAEAILQALHCVPCTPELARRLRHFSAALLTTTMPVTEDMAQYLTLCITSPDYQQVTWTELAAVSLKDHWKRLPLYLQQADAVSGAYGVLSTLEMRNLDVSMARRLLDHCLTANLPAPLEIPYLPAKAFPNMSISKLAPIPLMPLTANLNMDFMPIPLSSVLEKHGLNALCSVLDRQPEFMFMRVATQAWNNLSQANLQNLSLISYSRIQELTLTNLTEFDQAEILKNELQKAEKRAGVNDLIRFICLEGSVPSSHDLLLRYTRLPADCGVIVSQHEYETLLPLLPIDVHSRLILVNDVPVSYPSGMSPAYGFLSAETVETYRSRFDAAIDNTVFRSALVPLPQGGQNG